jgi:hypothetical protein
MQLRNARLCLDCEEVHDLQQCPACASESFSFITRWVPAPERRTRPRPVAEAPESLDTYRQMLTPQPQKGSPQWRLVKNGAMGLAIFGVASMVWRNKSRADRDNGEPRGERDSREREPTDAAR